MVQDSGQDSMVSVDGTGNGGCDVRSRGTQTFGDHRHQLGRADAASWQIAQCKKDISTQEDIKVWDWEKRQDQEQPENHEPVKSSIKREITLKFKVSPALENRNTIEHHAPAAVCHALHDTAHKRLYVVLNPSVPQCLVHSSHLHAVGGQ